MYHEEMFLCFFFLLLFVCLFFNCYGCLLKKKNWITITWIKKNRVTGKARMLSINATWFSVRFTCMSWRSEATLICQSSDWLNVQLGQICCLLLRNEDYPESVGPPSTPLPKAPPTHGVSHQSCIRGWGLFEWVGVIWGGKSGWLCNGTIICLFWPYYYYHYY